MNGTLSTSDRRRALLAILLAAVLWSAGGVLIKSVDWHPAAIAGMRSAIASVVLWCLFRNMHLTRSRYQIGGALTYAAMVTLFVVATKLTTAANAIFLQYTAPVHVALFSRWFLNERVTKSDIAIIAITLCGMGLFFLDRLTFFGFWGNIAAIVSGMAFAWTCLLVRREGEDTVEPLFLGNVLAALIGLPFMFGPGPGPDLVGWLTLIVLGVFQLGFSYALFSYAMKHLPALEVILISTIEPILNPLWVLLFLGELPGKWALIGGAVVVISVTLKGVMSVRQLPPARPTGISADITAPYPAFQDVAIKKSKL
jgi:drug/metabolite transporter (DMT)-like permease